MQDSEIAYIKDRYKCKFTIINEIILIEFKRKDSAIKTKTLLDLGMVTTKRYNILFISNNILRLAPKPILSMF